MALLVKAGIIGGLGTSVIVPVALTSSTDTKSVGLLDLDSPKEIEKQTPPKNTLEALSRAGYRKKSKDRWVDFNKNREAHYRGNFALGCHRLLFGGKNVPRLLDHDIEAIIWDWSPMSGYLGSEESEPVLGCSTAAIMKGESGGVYEFELGVKRGDKGFLERITVQKDKTAVSQLVFYEKVQNRNNKNKYSWFHRYGLQRKTKEKQNLEIGNPKNGTWTDLNIEGSAKDEPKYFDVWVADHNERQNEKSKQAMIDGLGIRFKSNQKLFSSIAKASRDDWQFNTFGSAGWGRYNNISVQANNEKKPATYTSKIANDVASFKGVWQDVTKFCESQEGRENEDLPHKDAERLRNYCYTNQPNKG